MRLNAPLCVSKLHNPQGLEGRTDDGAGALVAILLYVEVPEILMYMFLRLQHHTYNFDSLAGYGGGESGPSTVSHAPGSQMTCQ